MDLNKSKPFGTVFGAGHMHSFEQDGRYFDSMGNEVHISGEPVSVKEKMDRAKKEIETLAVKKKALLKKELDAIQEKEITLKAEARKIAVEEAAKKTHRLSDKMENMKTKEDIQEALDLLEYDYNKMAPKSDLEAVLEEILIAAG